jgi:hypothetical protein
MHAIIQDEVVIKAKGGECWQIYRHKTNYLFVIDGNINMMLKNKRK